MNKLLKSSFYVLFLALLLLGVPRLSGLIAGFFYYQAIDPDGSYAWVSVHHIVQALIFVIIIVIFNKFKPLDYGFGWGNKKVGKRCVLKFLLYFGIYSAGGFLTVFLTNSFKIFTYPMSATNIIGQMSFQLLLSGPSEELIFRAFAMTMLAMVIKGSILKGKVSLTNIIAAVIFGLAHVSVSFAPFKISYSLFQVIYATALGLFYGNCYEKSKSMYYPMIMHSISNVVMVGLTIVVTLFI